jgi:hypothetical protein
MFPHSLSSADLGVVILDERVSTGSVPSKAYNLMSLGIPALYVAGENSQLARDARRFGHAICFQSHQLDDIAAFVSRLATDANLRESMAASALATARNFRRPNADRFAQLYIRTSGAEA